VFWDGHKAAMAVKQFLLEQAYHLLKQEEGSL